MDSSGRNYAHWPTALDLPDCLYYSSAFSYCLFHSRYGPQTPFPDLVVRMKPFDCTVDGLALADKCHFFTLFERMVS